MPLQCLQSYHVSLVPSSVLSKSRADISLGNESQEFPLAADSTHVHLSPLPLQILSTEHSTQRTIKMIRGWGVSEARCVNTLSFKPISKINLSHLPECFCLHV